MSDEIRTEPEFCDEGCGQLVIYRDGTKVNIDGGAIMANLVVVDTDVEHECEG